MIYNVIMQITTGIRFFKTKPIRVIWNKKKLQWYYSAVDLIQQLVKPTNARKYWNDLKTKTKGLAKCCLKAKLEAEDGKYYETDVVNDVGISNIIVSLPNKQNIDIFGWIQMLCKSTDEQSKLKAYSLQTGNLLNSLEPGTVDSLLKIHNYIFGGIYSFAGKPRTKNISKGGFVFALCEHFPILFKQNDEKPQHDFDSIIDKYIEMNIIHPFMEGNGRATRIWLDLILKKELEMCVDWKKIDKKEYLEAMKISHIKADPIHDLIKNALTDKINDREIFIKGIDQSYFYEEVEHEIPNKETLKAIKDSYKHTGKTYENFDEFLKDLMK